ncbi:MAG: AAA family ATPase [Clostridiales bacterium]|nr:AAA family ATPase [Clostridiales bacterium]
MAGKRTVLEKLNQDCRNAYFAGIPVIYVKTYETELMHELIRLDEIVQRKMKNSAEVLVDYDDSQDKIPPWNYSEGLKNIDMSGKGPYVPRNSCPLEHNEWDCIHLTLARGEEVDNSRESRTPETAANLSRLENYVNAYISASEDSIIRRSVVILYSEKNYMPDCLQQYTEYIDVSLPDEEEIQDIIKKEFAGAPEVREKLLDGAAFTDFCGLNKTEIYRMIRRIRYMDDDELAKANILKKKIFQVKEQAVKRNEILELLDYKNASTDIGGLLGLKEYIDEIGNSIREERIWKESFGVEMSKGVLVCGIPGCGKSLAARFVASKLDLPLLKLDVGMLMGKYQGESEHNMQRALQMAEAMSPCVLFIDELDKAFSGSKGGRENDSGSFKRMFSRLLGWMQDKTKPCFIFATANDLTGLPSEFFRSGRFDRLYAMYLPTEDECIDIFQVRLLEKERNARRTKELFLQDWHRNKENIREIVTLFAGRDEQDLKIVTGADIEKLVNEALGAIASKHVKTGYITKAELKEEIRRLLRKTNVYGDGKENRIQIAKTYIQLMNLGFIPTTGEAMFDGYRFDKENNKVELCKGRMVSTGVYDAAVERFLTPLIRQMIPEFEEEMYKSYTRRA